MTCGRPCARSITRPIAAKARPRGSSITRPVMPGTSGHGMTPMTPPIVMITPIHSGTARVQTRMMPNASRLTR
ncbi:hypothetical protein BTZ20_4153 [Rhodococcus sp. MTM3W5.2]|nr:hypothetical protein BTZ20_4153 [Rhodococcus sp. MTM3W5.2]